MLCRRTGCLLTNDPTEMEPLVHVAARMGRPSVWDDRELLSCGSNMYYQYYQTGAASLLASEMTKPCPPVPNQGSLCC